MFIVLLLMMSSDSCSLDTFISRTALPLNPVSILFHIIQLETSWNWLTLTISVWPGVISFPVLLRVFQWCQVISKYIVFLKKWSKVYLIKRVIWDMSPVIYVQNLSGLIGTIWQH